MDALHSIDNSPLNQPQHADNKFVKSPASVGLIALGVILMIGGAVAAGVLHSHLGYISLSCLSTLPIGIALIVMGVRSGKGGVIDETILSTTNKASARQSTSGTEQTGRAINETSPSTTQTEPSRLDSRHVVSIGSQEARLNEEGIQEELKKINERDIEALIIYGDGNVELNRDPGLILRRRGLSPLNPKKLILVGTKIVHRQCSGGFRLDDLLSGKEEWLSSSTLVYGSKKDAQYLPETFIKQLIVTSVEEAIAHEPPQRGRSKGKYHLVYHVNE